MNDSKKLLRAVLDEMATDVLAEDGSHPEIATLEAYHEHKLSEAAAEKLCDHLVVCRECCDLLESIASYDDLIQPADGSGASDPQKDADWEALQARITAEKENLQSTTQTPIISLPIYKRLPFAYGLAATFLLFALGVSFQGNQVDSGPQPTPLKTRAYHTTVTTLYPVDDRTRGNDAGIQTITRNASSIPVIELGVSKELIYDSYFLNILKTSTQEVIIDKLQVTPLDGFFQFALTGFQDLSSENYEIQLYGVDENSSGTPALFHTYAFLLNSP